MNSHSSNAYHLDSRLNGSHVNGFGSSFPGTHRFNQSGILPGVPLTSGISATPPMMYKLSLQEIKKCLLQGHLSYLNRDDTPEKLAHKTKLQGLIVEYLSMVPHCDKFENTEIAECFDKSIIENKDFTACRAASAFEVLEKYATSLLTKPWRKEFRTIYPYGGYMKGLVDKQLREASKILYLMGYRNKNVNGVIVYSAESSIIDPDTLARVSLDCLIAFVECQMMIQIADALKRKNISLSWLQILNIRANSICSMDQLVNYVFDSDKLIDFETDPSSKYGKQTYPVIQSRRFISQQPQVSQYHQNGCPMLRETRRKHDIAPSKELVNHSNVDNSRARDLIHFSGEEQRSPNVIYHGIHTPTGYIAPPPMFASELSNANSYAENHNSYSSYNPSCLHQHVQHPQQSTSSSFPPSLATNYLAQPKYNDLNLNKSDVDVIDGALNSFNFKSSGPKPSSLDRRSAPLRASNRDVIRSDESYRLPVETSVTNSNASSCNTSKIASNSTGNNASNKKLEERINAILKSFSDEDKSRKPTNDEPRDRKKDKVLVEKRIEPLDRVGKTREKSFNKSNNSSEASNIDNGAWSCAYCTFLNTNQTDICDMCSRSRERPGLDNTNLTSCGKVCKVCTLVNSEEADHCSACEHSLRNSPTYI
ncbi:uncharacterized protein LOC107363475 [Tetranychus urticae]|uniref:RanBP2-type domain-containing protein n=1 Tax=Tetranychus urticae TaxID=32264 RepID=T1KFV1_TETUR|nr:uncharacterized protein LOC107363475 [Tetranychus urticae]